MHGGTILCLSDQSMTGVRVIICVSLIGVRVERVFLSVCIGTRFAISLEFVIGMKLGAILKLTVMLEFNALFFYHPLLNSSLRSALVKWIFFSNNSEERNTRMIRLLIKLVYKYYSN